MKRFIKLHSSKALHTIKKLPQHKSHLDFFAAILAIPMMITIIAMNIINFNKAQTSKNTPTPTPIVVQLKQADSAVPQITTIVVQPSLVPSPTQGACTPDIGQISVSSLQENQTVSANPLTISIAYNGKGFCAVAWAYKINNGDWSNFDNTSSVAAYNLPAGANMFTLQVKSLVADKSQTIIRHFTYNSDITPTPTVMPISTPTP